MNGHRRQGIDCGRVYNLLESEFPVIIVKNGEVH
jgi:hypothetical protein